eukprot:TRINITY_DN3657_c0_g1_i6.p1 TRINITY_DN3657_c0_g1~~TRINITY_DN3657_c0_g1_i6.p1  ORF type:complete len:737 (-),score=150.46 TRINITY_DN3657_c0_g1_i6:58-2268(-)
MTLQWQRYPEGRRRTWRKNKGPERSRRTMSSFAPLDIAAIVVSSTALAVIIILSIYCCYVRRSERKGKGYSKLPRETDGYDDDTSYVTPYTSFDSPHHVHPSHQHQHHPSEEHQRYDKAINTSLSSPASAASRNNNKNQHIQAGKKKTGKSKDIFLKDITIVKLLGSGTFGQVYLGRWQGVNVALKMILSQNNNNNNNHHHHHDHHADHHHQQNNNHHHHHHHPHADHEHDARVRELMHEASIFRTLRHPNIINYYGLYEDPHTREVSIVTQYMSEGSLDKFLTKTVLSDRQTLQLARDVCAGMLQLENHRIVHCDLACRNLLVSLEDKSYHIKITDFGISRQTSPDANIYSPIDITSPSSSDNPSSPSPSSESPFSSCASKLPIKWAAPEAIQAVSSSNPNNNAKKDLMAFHSTCDVWSFGVTFWEMMHPGQQPYATMTNQQAYNYIMQGNRLTLPNTLPPILKEIIERCWRLDPSERPSFEDIMDVLDAILAKRANNKPVDHVYSSDIDVSQGYSNFEEDGPAPHKEDSKHEKILKFTIIGDQGVGKSSLVSRFTNKTFEEKYKPTIGADFGQVSVTIAAKAVKIQLWDIPGNKKLAIDAYYKTTVGVLVVYDVTRRSTFDDVAYWLQQVKQHVAATDEDIVIAIVGTKIDKEDERVVSKEEGQRCASENKTLFFETSAATALNTEDAFLVVAAKIIHKMQQKQKQVDGDQEYIVYLGDDEEMKPPRHASNCVC